MKDILKDITERFIKQLEQGTVPWRKPWLSSQNIVSQKPYRGINTLLLGSTTFTSPWWMTFKQARDLGGNVAKGARATPIVYFKFLDKLDKSGNVVLNKNGAAVQIPFIRWSMVFNLDQTEKVKAPDILLPQRPDRPLEAAAEIIKKANLCPVKHGGFAALYSPTDDVIRMPHKKLFQTEEDYYHTLYHEAAHATGHQSRLDREGVTMPAKFGSERYSKEELIAELSAAFMSNQAGILDKVRFDNSASYLSSWISKLKADPSLLLSAASQAQKSADFIFGVKQAEKESPENVGHLESNEHIKEPLNTSTVDAKLQSPTFKARPSL